MTRIEINGKVIELEGSATIIEAADQAGIPLPRFCYHKKLSVAANCRMCLVEVEKSPKPLPACATPVGDGMKIWTNSPKAVAAQQGVMEFLLINHPLDCPICDQGGECELQDLALGYGHDASRYEEEKRVVKDQNLGPLIATDMTRCIHCTRCVRFGVEVAGLAELGATGRGERMRIGTYLEQNLRSEVSGNVIDLCPVGALTSKPYRYTARGWELRQRFGVSPHDSLGSHLSLHTRNGKVMRVIPREAESLNEVWISDRDRFSYEALEAPSRLLAPLIKKNGNWEALSWEEALNQVQQRLETLERRHGTQAWAGFVSPNTSTEESLLLAQWMQGRGARFLEHRLRQSEASLSDDITARCPSLGVSVQALDAQEAILLWGCQMHAEQPILGLRLRRAALAGTQVFALNPVPTEYHFPVQGKVAGRDYLYRVAAMVKAVLEAKRAKQPELEAWLASIIISKADRDFAATWIQKEKTVVILGALAISHPEYAGLLHLASAMAQLTGSQVAVLPWGANHAGVYLSSQALLPKTPLERESIKAWCLWGVDPTLDGLSSETLDCLRQAEFVLAATPFRSPSLDALATLYLPLAAPFEAPGTFINLEGRWQTFPAAGDCPGEAKPGWKILRVLGKRSGLAGFECENPEEILPSLQASLKERPFFEPWPWPEQLGLKLPPLKEEPGGPLAPKTALLLMSLPAYRSDALVRQAPALQATLDPREPRLGISQAQAQVWDLKAGDTLLIQAGDREAEFFVTIQPDLPEGCLHLPAGYEESALFKPFEMVTILNLKINTAVKVEKEVFQDARVKKVKKEDFRPRGAQ